MAANRNVAVIVGSLRKESFNRKMALSLQELAPPGLSLQVLEIGNLPLYNQDEEAQPPAASAAFKQAVKQADAVLFVTPEYNRSMPGSLKNAIDVASRPYGQSAWDGKPGGVITCSPGALGGYGANHHLRDCLVFLNVPVLQQPEAYIGGVGNAFDAAGKLVDTGKREFMQKFMAAYAAWVDKILSARSAG